MCKKIFEISREKAIKDLENDYLSFIQAQLKKNDFTWIKDVLNQGFIGFDTMDNEGLMQEYWEQFSLDQKYHNIKIHC